MSTAKTSPKLKYSAHFLIFIIYHRRDCPHKIPLFDQGGLSHSIGQILGRGVDIVDLRGFSI
jgi:hypothetical protein